MPRIADNRTSPSGPRGGIRIATAQLPVGTVATAGVTLFTCVLTGALTTDLVTVNPMAALKAGTGIAGARVVAAGVLGVYQVNPTAAAITVAARVLRVELRQYPARRGT